MKKNSNFYLKYIAVVSLCLLLVGGYFAVSALRGRSNSDIVGVEKDNPYYSLRNNATAYQKELYKEISSEFKKEPLDQTKISGLVVQNYVADFYTWTNKLRFNDVGGLQYLHKDIQGWVNAQALESFYGDVRYYLEKGTLAETLEVSKVDVSVEKSEFILEDGPDGEENSQPSYVVHATWTYKESTLIETASYQKEAIFTLIADDEGLFSIVEVQNVEEAE